MYFSSSSPFLSHENFPLCLLLCWQHYNLDMREREVARMPFCNPIFSLSSCDLHASHCFLLPINTNIEHFCNSMKRTSHTVDRHCWFDRHFFPSYVPHMAFGYAYFQLPRRVASNHFLEGLLGLKTSRSLNHSKIPKILHSKLFLGDKAFILKFHRRYTVPL